MLQLQVWFPDTLTMVVKVKFFLVIFFFIGFCDFTKAESKKQKMDVLFVVDNSGSMSATQQNIVKNTKIFLEQFALQPYLDWKIGLISTDIADAPYLGFENSFEASNYDFRDPQTINYITNLFQNSIERLGAYGSGSEYVFYNVKRVLNTHKNFLRKDSNFVIIMISDEKEQSQYDFGDEYDATYFLKTLNQYINQKIRFYGALKRKDLKDCDHSNTGDNETYVGSQYETIVNLTKGFTVSACVTDFGSELAKIGKDIDNFSYNFK